MSEAANVLGGFYSELENLLSEDDLGAVIIHMNDTYQIEERRVGDRLELPGFARIAEFIRKTRGLVCSKTGEDRTLVVHSGDFLSPSYLSNRCKTHGQHIVDLFAAAGG